MWGGGFPRSRWRGCPGRACLIPALAAVVAFLRNGRRPEPSRPPPVAAKADGPGAVDDVSSTWSADPRRHGGHSRTAIDLAEVRGQGAARRALEIAAAGGHNVLLVG